MPRHHGFSEYGPGKTHLSLSTTIFVRVSPHLQQLQTTDVSFHVGVKGNKRQLMYTGGYLYFVFLSTVDLLGLASKPLNDNCSKQG